MGLGAEKIMERKKIFQEAKRCEKKVLKRERLFLIFPAQVRHVPRRLA
jgi:hypothetical protein